MIKVISFFIIFNLSITMVAAQGIPPGSPAEDAINNKIPDINLPNGGSVQLTPGQRVEIITPSGIVIDINVGEGVTISVNASSSHPASDKLPAQANSEFINIELSENVTVDAKINIPLTDNAFTNSVYFMENNNGSEWQRHFNAIKIGQVMEVNTNHFSTWVVVSEPSGIISNPIFLALVGIGLIAIIVKIRKSRK